MNEIIENYWAAYDGLMDAVFDSGLIKQEKVRHDLFSVHICAECFIDAIRRDAKEIERLSDLLRQNGLNPEPPPQDDLPF